MLYNNSFIILHLAFLSMLVLFFVSFVNYKKDFKNIVNLSFMLMILCEVIWCLGQLLEVYSRYFTGKIHMEFVYLYFSGMILISYFILMFCYTFINPQKKLSAKWLFLLIPQLISLTVLFSNDKYHLFIVQYAPLNIDMKLGAYFKFHNILISYPYILVGLYYILVNGYYRKETSRLNSKQIPFILSGILIPFIVNALSTFKIIVAPTYISAVASISTGILWYMIIYKYNFISSDQVAVRYIYDNLNDCILVVNEDDIIIDYNEKFLDLFSSDIVKISMDLKVLKKEMVDPAALNNLKKLDFYLKNDPYRKDKGDFFVVHNLTQYFEIECKSIEKCKILILKDRTKQHWQVIETIIKIVDAKNKYTSGHSARVAKYSVKIAAQLKMEKDEIMTLWSAGLAHDIGKIGLSDEILNSDKRYAPDSNEFREIKRHVEVGAALIGSLEEFSYLQPIVLYHHERIDGKGYLGLKGNEIPFMSRVLAVADTYDAMSSGRKYQDKPIRECYEVLNILAKSDIGTQLDEECFNAFVQVMINEGYIKKFNDENGKFIGTGKLHDFVERNDSNKLIIREDYEEELSIDIDNLYKSLIY